MKPFACCRTLTLCCVSAALTTACTPFTRIQGDGDATTRINGSWSVLWSGEARLEGVEPRPTIVFDTSASTVSGFDGCNAFKGSYRFDDGRIKAKLASTRRACVSEAARGVSEQIAGVFDEGAEAVEMSVMGARVLRLKSASAELRVAPTGMLKEN